MTPSITEDDVEIALCNFLANVTGLPSGQVVIGQTNRVAEPLGDFVIIWPINRQRLGTNVDLPSDTKGTGSISGTVMTISAVAIGAFGGGNQVFGVNVAANTMIVNQLTGPAGGVGTYTITPSQAISSQTLSAGTNAISTTTEVVMQVDVHGPHSADNAQTIQQLFRDQYGVDQFAGTGISPLFAEGPRQAPFINAAKEYEDRWTLDVHLQIDPTIFVPQQFADKLTVTVTNALVAIEE